MARNIFINGENSFITLKNHKENFDNNPTAKKRIGTYYQGNFRCGKQKHTRNFGFKSMEKYRNSN